MTQTTEDIWKAQSIPFLGCGKSDWQHLSNSEPNLSTKQFCICTMALSLSGYLLENGNNTTVSAALAGFWFSKAIRYYDTTVSASLTGQYLGGFW
jgi:hypothetical protein